MWWELSGFTLNNFPIYHKKYIYIIVHYTPTTYLSFNSKFALFDHLPPTSPHPYPITTNLISFFYDGLDFVCLFDLTPCMWEIIQYFLSNVWLISFSIPSSWPMQPQVPLSWASLVAQLVKNLPAMQETWAWYRVGKIPWRREWLPTPVFWPREFHGLQSMGLQRGGHDWATFTFIKIYFKVHPCCHYGRIPSFLWLNPVQASHSVVSDPLLPYRLQNPRGGGAWWAAIYGVTQSWTRLTWLSSSSRDL